MRAAQRPRQLRLTRTSWPIRGMVGWFGVRGIGSLYYLMYAIQHGLPEALALEPIQLTLIAVSLSIRVQETAIAREVIQASVGAARTSTWHDAIILLTL